MHVVMCAMCVKCLRRSEGDVRSPGTRFTDDCQSPYGCWKSNWWPLEEYPVFSVTSLLSCHRPYLDAQSANSIFFWLVWNRLTIKVVRKKAWSQNILYWSTHFAPVLTWMGMGSGAFFVQWRKNYPSHVIFHSLANCKLVSCIFSNQVSVSMKQSTLLPAWCFMVLL